jgi:hypothetical protein
MEGKGKNLSGVAMIGEEREVITSDQLSFTGMGLRIPPRLPLITRCRFVLSVQLSCYDWQGARSASERSAQLHGNRFAIPVL